MHLKILNVHFVDRDAAELVSHFPPGFPSLVGVDVLRRFRVFGLWKALSLVVLRED